jgi:hypothetical protein
MHAGLADADRAVLAIDAQQAPPLDEERLELLDPGRGHVAQARAHQPSTYGFRELSHIMRRKDG